MGIPIEAERGPCGMYRLAKGYQLPPLMFTDGEAMALTLGLLAIRKLRFPVNIAGIEGALAKTQRVMPEKLLNQARALQETITFHPSSPVPQVQNEFVVMLSSAVQQRQQVILHYLPVQGKESERAFDPYGIVFNQGYWYTSGYCHLRNDLRTFRLDRNIALELGRQTFACPEGFDALAHLLNSVAIIPGEYQVEVLLKTTLEQAQQVLWSPKITLVECSQGVLLRSNTDQLDWVARFLIGLDMPFTVIRPIELGDKVRQIATNVLQMMNEAATS